MTAALKFEKQGTIELDVSHWPVIVVSAPDKSMPDQELEAFLDEFRLRVGDRDQPYATVLDLTHASSMSARQRKMMGERLRTSNKHQRYNVVGAFVFTSVLMRGMLTAIMWLKKPEYPCRIFATTEEAVTWAKARMAEHAAGLPISTEGVLEGAATSHDQGSLLSADEIERRLITLQKLHDRGVISREELEQRRSRVLESL